jgi:hypothetical protein
MPIAAKIHGKWISSFMCYLAALGRQDASEFSRTCSCLASLRQLLLIMILSFAEYAHLGILSEGRCQLCLLLARWSRGVVVVANTFALVGEASPQPR